MSCFSAEHFLLQDFFVKQLAENRKNKAKCLIGEKIVYKEFYQHIDEFIFDTYDILW